MSELPIALRHASSSAGSTNSQSWMRQAVERRCGAKVLSSNFSGWVGQGSGRHCAGGAAAHAVGDELQRAGGLHRGLGAHQLGLEVLQQSKRRYQAHWAEYGAGTGLGRGGRCEPRPHRPQRLYGRAVGGIDRQLVGCGDGIALRPATSWSMHCARSQVPTLLLSADAPANQQSRQMHGQCSVQTGNRGSGEVGMRPKAQVIAGRKWTSPRPLQAWPLYSSLPCGRRPSGRPAPGRGGAGQPSL